MNKISNIKPLGFNWEMSDPFIFCAHHRDHYPKGNDKQGPDPAYLQGRNLGNDFELKDGFRMYHGDVVPGFPVHPHRGFEIITITLEGLIDHSDSLNGAARYGHGDVQWITAGKGIQHTEMFPLINRDRDNPLELFQIWLNLPRKSKLVAPYYQMFWQEDIPIVEKTDKSGKRYKVRLIAGRYEGTDAPKPTPDSWAADPANEVGIWIFDLDPGVEAALPPAAEGVKRTMYYYNGEGLTVNGSDIPVKHQAELDASETLNIKNSGQKSTFIVLQGKPIAEPVAQYGPFVMNSRGEIQQAYQEYTETGFGGWPWDSNAPVHGKEAKRFARYASGETEER